MIDLKQQLHTYKVTIPLRYYTYDLHSDQKDSEYVMGLKQDIDWDVDLTVEEPIPDTDQLFRQQEKVHFCLSCQNDQDNEQIPEDHFVAEITNIVAHDRDEARAFVKPYLYRICRTLSFFLSRHNCNKHSYQPRVETDMEHATWDEAVYEPFDQLLHTQDDTVETMWIDGKKYQVITVEMAPITISTSVYSKIFGKMPVDDFLSYAACTDADLNYMLDEFYLALGQENRYSKFFHLFSIIEFVEKRYEDQNGANRLFEPEQADAIMDAVLDCPVLDDKEKRDRVRGAFKQVLGNLTDIGRKEKLVNILHWMGIERIENCGTQFVIDNKMIGQLIYLRNKCYHGDRQNDDQAYVDVDLAVTQLMYICERIIVAQIEAPRME